MLKGLSLTDNHNNHANKFYLYKYHCRGLTLLIDVNEFFISFQMIVTKISLQIVRAVTVNMFERYP